MTPQLIFLTQLVLGYVACLLVFGTYILPSLRSMARDSAQRVIGPALPAGFAPFAAYGDFATGILALLALLTARIRPLFWSFVAAFNVVGTTDLIVDYYHAVRLGLPNVAGQLGATYIIPIVYVPMLMITHAVALYWLVRPQSAAVQALAGNAVA
jgi:hypothetical protein